MAGITKEQVFAAADEIIRAEEGLLPEKVTIAAVRDSLGTGSMTTITKHLREWKEAFSVDTQMPAHLAAEATSFFNALFSKAKAEATEALTEERAELLLLVDEREAAAEATIARSNELEAELMSARGQAVDLQTEVDRLSDEANRLSSAHEDERKRADKASERNTQLERENAQLKAELTSKFDKEKAGLEKDLAVLMAKHEALTTQNEYISGLLKAEYEGK